MFLLDYIKIDKALVQDLETSQVDQELDRTIINLAKYQKLGLVAEGIKTPWQLRILQAEGCEVIQRYTQTHWKCMISAGV